MKTMKKVFAAALAVILAAGTLAASAPAQAATSYYRQTYYKYENWNDKTDSWELLHEYKYTLNSKGNTLTYYSRNKSYDSQSQKYVWRNVYAIKYVYNSDGTTKQANLYSDIKFKNYNGKEVYTYTKKGSSRRLSKITTYDKNNKVTEISTYTFNSKGQQTKVVTTNAKKEKLREYTSTYNSDGTRKTSRSDNYENGKKSYWYTRSYTYKNHNLVKEIEKNSSGYTYTYTYKNGLITKSVSSGPNSTETTVYTYNSKKQLIKETSKRKSNNSSSTTVITYSGHDKHNNYTKSKRVYTSGSYSYSTDYKYARKYSGNNLTQVTVTRKDENSDKYVNDYRDTFTYKKITR